MLQEEAYYEDERPNLALNIKIKNEARNKNSIAGHLFILCISASYHTAGADFTRESLAGSGCRSGHGAWEVEE